jgi:hypothetical protein
MFSGYIGLGCIFYCLWARKDYILCLGGVNLKFSFRKTVDSATMEQWYEILQIASTIQFSKEEETIVWQYHSSVKYFVQTLYAIVNNRGIKQVFILVMWKIPVTSRLHVFLWLLANNKVLTRDNLTKRWPVSDKTCLFCTGNEFVWCICSFAVVWPRICGVSFLKFLIFLSLLISNL